MEERNRIAVFAPCPLGNRESHAVTSRAPSIVGPLREEVASVDHEAVVDWLDRDPVAFDVFNFESSTARTRQQDCDGSVVSVNSCSQLALLRGLGDGRVVNTAKRGQVLVNRWFEVRCRQAEGLGHQLEDAAGEILHRVVVRLPGRAERGWV